MTKSLQPHQGKLGWEVETRLGFKELLKFDMWLSDEVKLSTDSSYDAGYMSKRTVQSGSVTHRNFVSLRKLQCFFS